MQFFKMQNCGNDYIFIFERITSSQIVKLCDRNFGIGGDGVVYLYKKGGRYGFEIYNKDGSRASFCGSVALCLGLYVYRQEGLKSFKIITDSGIKKVEIVGSGKNVKVCVEVGKPHFSVKNSADKPPFNKLLFLKSEGKILKVRASYVNVGNDHLVIRGLYNEQKRARILKGINNSNLFPSGVNVEFTARKISGARVIVYERGSGKTLCCSSGGCAVFAVLYKLGHFEKSEKLYFDGGVLQVESKNKSICVYSYPKFLYYGNWCEI